MTAAFDREDSDIVEKKMSAGDDAMPAGVDHASSDMNQYLIHLSPQQLKVEKLSVEKAFYLGQTVWAGHQGLQNLQGSFVNPIEMVLCSLLFQGFAQGIDATGTGRFTAKNAATGDENELQDWGGLDVSMALGLTNQLCFQPHVLKERATVTFVKESYNRNGCCGATCLGDARRARPEVDENSAEFSMLLHPFWTCMQPGPAQVEKKRHKDFDDDIGRLCFCGWSHLAAFGFKGSLPLSERKQWCFAAGYYGDTNLVYTLVRKFSDDTAAEATVGGGLSEPFEVAVAKWLAKFLESALRGAAAGGQTDLGRFLIHQLRVSPLAVDDAKRPPFAFAVRAGQDDFAFLLLKYGADAKYVTSKGRTALHLASKNGHQGLVNALLDRGISVDIEDNYKTRPIHEAVMHNHLGCVASLVSRGADITARDSRGAEVIHVASFKGLSDIVEYLLEVSKEKKLKTAKNPCAKHNLSPLHYAIMGSRDPKVIEQLLDNGADPNQVDRPGRSCYHLVEEQEAQDAESKDADRKERLKAALFAMRNFDRRKKERQAEIETSAGAKKIKVPKSSSDPAGLKVRDDEDIM